MRRRSRPETPRPDRATISRLDRCRASGADAGASLAELLVAMVLLGLFSALFVSVIIPFHQTVRRQQGISASSDPARQVLLALDKEVRYADTINNPGTASGHRYVEYRWQKATATGVEVRCSQWRVTSAGSLQRRGWPVDAAGAPKVLPLPGWQTVSAGVVTTTPGWVPFALPEADVPATTEYQQQMLRVDLTFRGGRPVSTTRTTVTLAASNSTSSSAGSTVCNPSGWRS